MMSWLQKKVLKNWIIELKLKGGRGYFSKIKNSNHFFKNKEEELSLQIDKYLKEKTALI